jgi:hypothetical protein
MVSFTPLPLSPRQPWDGHWVVTEPVMVPLVESNSDRNAIYSRPFIPFVLSPHYMLHARGIWWRKREFQRSIFVIVIRDDNMADSCTAGQRSHDDDIAGPFPAFSAMDGCLHWSAGALRETVVLAAVAVGCWAVNSFVRLPVLHLSRSITHGCITSSNSIIVKNGCGLFNAVPSTCLGVLWESTKNFTQGS